MAARRVRSAIPMGARHRIAMARLRYREPTGRVRALPGALIIGAQRCGTSSLYRYLGAHPAAAPSFRKEVEYFSRRYGSGERWYRGHFTVAGRRRLSFEATPDYLFHPLAPARAAALLPEAKLIVLLRDPVARAWSHYQHMVGLGYESLPFDDALAAEPDRTRPDLERLADDPLHDARALLLFSYAGRGRYAEQLDRWLLHYPRDRLLIVRSEDFYRDTPRWYGEIIRFLGLPAWQPRAFRNQSQVPDGQPRAEPSPASAAALREAFRAPNAELAALLGAESPWW